MPKKKTQSPKHAPLLHYEIHGTGPTVVLLHGYMMSSRYWETLTKLIAQDYRVIALDLLGFGKSPKPHCSRYDYDAQLRSITATLKRLAVAEPFILVGHSMGALLSLRFANLYPQRVRKLFLTNMPIMLTRAEAKREIFGTRAFYRLGLTPGTHQVIWTLFRVLTAARLLPRTVAAELNTRTAYLFQSSAAARLRSFRNVILDAKVEADLRALNVRTVVLSGVNDRALYLKNLANMILGPQVVLQNVEGGHHLPQFRPELLVRLLKDAGEPSGYTR